MSSVTSSGRSRIVVGITLDAAVGGRRGWCGESEDRSLVAEKRNLGRLSGRRPLLLSAGVKRAGPEFSMVITFSKVPARLKFLPSIQ